MTRVKIFSIFLFSTMLLFVHTWIIPFFMIVALSAINRSVIEKRFKPLLIVFFFVLLFQLLFNTTLTIEQRLYQGIFAGSRIIALSLLVFWFTETTSSSEIIRTLSFLPANFRLVLTISLSLIPVLLNEIGSIQRAQQSRGKSTILSILIPLLHRTLKRSEQIAIVLQTRGYVM